MDSLGVFDSGLGGFNIVARLREHSSLNIVFLADHKNLPYGNKDSETLKAILIENMQWFYDKNIKRVLIACNTASNYIDYLRANFPDMIIDSIIEITSNQFTDEDLVIFGTKVTCESKKYDETLNKEQTYHPLVELASLVEENNEEVTSRYLKSELSKYKNEDTKYLLACTHYSIVKDLFKKYLNDNVYDSELASIQYYKDFVGERKLEVYTSGNIKVLSNQLAEIFNYRDIFTLPYKDDYTIVVLSDNHGLYEPLSTILERHKDASIFIHCGDVELNDPITDKFYVVNGNNDYYTRYDDHIILSINDLIIYITHSHEYMPFSRLDNLYKYGKSINAKLVCFGHEHIYQEHYYDDMLIVNPGSLYYNRDNSDPSYALINVNKDNLKVFRMKL